SPWPAPRGLRGGSRRQSTCGRRTAARLAPFAGRALTMPPARLIKAATYVSGTAQATRRGPLMQSVQMPVYLTYATVALRFVPVVALVAWCLWAINWRKAWPVLAAGGWAPLVLVGLMAAFVWSLIWPSTAVLFGAFAVPNGLWQFGSVALLIGLVLFGG